MRNSTAPAGAALYLTKPLGLGIVSTAIKRGLADRRPRRGRGRPDDDAEPGRVRGDAAAGAQAATDVTGFGLLGHLHRMLLASGVAAELDAAAVPLLDPRILDLARRDVIPGGTKRNLAHVRPHTDFGELPEPERAILADAQTSGGLLIAVDDPGRLEAACHDRGVPAARIGTVVAGEPGRITVPGALAV